MTDGFWVEEVERSRNVKGKKMTVGRTDMNIAV